MKFKSYILVSIICLTVLSACNSQTESYFDNDISTAETSDTVNTTSTKTTITQSEMSDATTTSTPEVVETNPTTQSKAPTVQTKTPTTTTATTATTATESSTAESKPAPITATTAKITIPEGYSFAQITEMMEKKGVCSKADLMNTINTYDFSYYSLVSQIKNNPNRCFKLEGYLFPDTYEFKLNEKPENVIGKFLRNAEVKITDSYRARAKKLGYTMDEILTIASIIEKEAGKYSEMAKVSSVLHNRLKIERKLECDATINYVEYYIKPYISGDKNRYNSYYNTYKCSALPSGPIANPGVKAIEAALYPADTEYLFFLSDANGKYYYGLNGAEHEANKVLAGIKTES